MADNRIGIVVEPIGNGYIVSYYKDGGWSGANGPKMFIRSEEDLVNSLGDLYREAASLEVDDPGPPDFMMLGGDS